MDQTLRQLGELLLTALPTVFCVLIIWAAYRNLVQRKLEAVLAERRARTQGAMAQAQAEIASAETRTAEYEQRLRDSRSQLYKEQEERRRRMIERRAEALAEARRQAEQMVKAARSALEREVAAARTMLQEQADSMAAQVIESILKPATAAESRTS